MTIGIVIGLMFIGGCVGAVMIFPIAYALGSEHAHRATRDNFAELRDRRRA